RVLHLAIVGCWLGLAACTGDGVAPAKAGLSLGASPCPPEPIGLAGTPVRASLEAALERTGRASTDRIVYARRVPYPELADSVDYAHLCSVASGELSKFSVLASTGEELSEPEIQLRRVATANATHGKMSARLRAKLAKTGGSAKLEVLVWFSEKASDLLKPSDHDPTFVARLQQDRFAKNTATRSAATAAVARAGGKVLRTLSTMPILVAEVSSSAIPTLALDADVAQVDYEDINNPARPLSAGYTHFYDADDHEAAEQFANLGYHGYGIKVGIYERTAYAGLWHQGSGFANLYGYTEHPLGPPAVKGCAGQSNGVACPDGCPGFECYCQSGVCYGEHITMVASKLGSAFGTSEYRNADRMHLYFASYGYKADKLDWLAQQGVHVANDSDAEDDYPAHNYAVRSNYMTITKAAGNSWNEPVACYENSVCTGSYSIGIVNYVDAWKTNPDNNPAQYGMSGSTSFIDPPNHWDSEKPDVMGNGEATLRSSMVTPATPSGWGLALGTSFAAPVIGGMVAVLQELFPDALYWPELVRPMLMVAAFNHNVDGNPLSRNPYHLDPGDEKDGAGVPTALGLKLIVNNTTYRKLTLYPGTFDGYGRYDPQVRFWVGSGDAVRAVLGWTYCSQSGSSFLATDLDLTLIDENTGYSLDYSNSSTNSLEMLEWKNTGAGRYVRFRVSKYGNMQSCNGVQREYAGLAWWLYTPQW
ncbi:MAG: S8 family peptidase, partial [Armatimonadetes bacterium]|nr:S8 family peptidase [Armatimonadota bacterium]